jgi:hypothetical protein
LCTKKFACCLKLGSSHDVHHAATTTGAELDCASSQCEQGVILATAYAGAWVEVGATLANDDFACLDFLTTVALYA